MDTLTILNRNIKWRFHNTFIIIATLLQPLLWLLLYGVVGKQAMKGVGIDNYTSFIVPGLIVLVSLGACSSSGIINYLMKADGSYYRVLIAPINRRSIVLGQMLESVLCAFLEVGIMLIIGVFMGLRFESGFIGFMLIIIIVFFTAFFVSGLTYAISLFLPNEIIYETVMNAIVLPLFFLSSALFPIDGINGILVIIMNLNPFTHVINALRSLLLYQDSITIEIFYVILMLIIMSCISFTLALYKLIKETRI